MINNPSAKRVTGIIVFFYFINSGLSQTPGSLIWQSSTGWHVHSVASTGDLNGDNVPDVFAGSGNDAVYCFSGNGGNTLWTWNTTNDAWTVASLNDVNGDGIHDCLAGSANNMIYCISGQPVGGSTTTIWTYPVGGDVWSVAAIGDLNNDGINDCLAGAGDNRVYCLSGANGQLLWSYTSTSDIVTVSAIPDVNGDGKEDCLAGGHGDRILCISGGSSGTGTLLWYYDMGSSVLSVAPIPDVNDDGVSDCLAVGMDENVFCISGNSSGTASLIWNFPTEAWVHSVSAISDVDGDGVADCVAGGRDDKIFCISGDSGNLIWSYLTGATLLSVASIADVNGSGGEDCIAGGEDNHIYCIEGKSTGNGQLIWSHNTVGTVNSVAAIADISGNGSTDVIGGSDDSYVYAVEGGESGTPSEIISTPNPPTGSSIGTVGQILSFTASGASSNLGHSVQYRFDWGDGNFSGWGSASQGHSFTNVSTYTIKAQARCQTHTGVVSGWSAGKSVTVSGHTLTVLVIGSGSVAKNPDKSGYNHNENVTLTATPTSGYQFDHWGGDLSGTNNPAVLTMNSNKNVTAYFTQTAETVSSPNPPTGSSIGTVGQILSFTASGASSNLGHSVQYRFDWGDGNFSGWGSASQGHSFTNVSTYTIKAQARCQTHTGVVSGWSPGKSVTVSGHTLTVLVIGSGSVTKNPDKSGYNHNESVSLTATPTAGYQFDHWWGDLSGNNNPAVLTMNSNKNVTAYFTQTAETVSSPNIPTGPSTGKVGQSLSFSTGGSTSNLGHNVQYHFDWGDGNFSDWGSASQSYSYTNAGNFTVKAQARCQTHTGVVSGWSPGKSVTVSGHTLTVLVIGSGSVAKNPDKSGYNHNENVTLTATPTLGYQFDHWGGDLSGNNNPAVLIMNGDKSVTAYFTQTAEIISSPNTPIGPSTGKVGQNLSFTTGGSTSNLGHNVQYHFDWGDGSISGWGSASQNHSYINATTYMIRAQARCQTHTGVISSWSSSKTVTVSGHTLTVSVNGSGSVSKNPSKNSYNHNEIVTLLADPASGFQFAHWEGNLSGNTNPAFLTMNSNKIVTAYFTQTLETVSIPNTPTGPSSGSIEQSLNFTTGGSISSLGHAVEYRFNWGDGNISDWGISSQNHSWSTSGFFLISAQARCKEHSVTSNWSSWIVITIIDTFIEQIEISKIPSDFLLTQNYPNPFNGETWITYQLPRTCDVRLDVFNINGERIATIASGLSSPGLYRIKWNGKRDDGEPVPSGLYMYRLATDEYRSVKVMMYIK